MFKPRLGCTCKVAGAVKTISDALVAAATATEIWPLWVSPPEEV